MRTCPNCGRNTSAETTSPCTKCGWFPGAPVDVGEISAGSTPYETGEASFPAPEPAPSPTRGDTPPAPAPSRGDGPSFPAPQPSPSPMPSPLPRRRGPSIGAIWLILIVVGIISQAAGALDGCGEAFEEKPGPTAEEVESALASDAEMLGLAGASASCPDSSEDTEVGQTFDCTVTAATGQAATVTVTNGDGEFEWSRASFFQLLQQQPAPR